jgi:CheY-like chemotaxis protein
MENKYVLIIEDNRIDTLVHTKIIQITRPDIEVVHAENGKAALARLEERPYLPVMTLLDLIMPVMDGFEFLEKLAANPRYKGLIVAVLTTSTNMQDRKKASAIFDISEYVIKPLTKDRFTGIFQSAGF